uniref:Calcitonin-like diuretic hormone receptor 2 variant A n=1 Tax=Rhodnius prolixus TaxID=13249 RepID=V5UZF0_RHOPR|nr:calcitonin-like diuretic hormone receptor 2 variant A [Rhodnius prolixus]
MGNVDNLTTQSNLHSNILRYLKGLQRECDLRKRAQFQYLSTILPNVSDLKVYCPATFDGWSCWNTTPSGEIALAPCPNFVTGFDINISKSSQHYIRGWILHIICSIGPVIDNLLDVQKPAMH